MKVTQIVKQAIQEKVENVIKAKQAPLETALENLKKESRDFQDARRDELRKILKREYTRIFKDFLKKHKDIKFCSKDFDYSEHKYNYDDDVDAFINRKFNNFNCNLDYIYYRLDEIKELEDSIGNLEKLKGTLVNNIILELELGKSKASFEEILEQNLEPVQDL